MTAFATQNVNSSAGQGFSLLISSGVIYGAVVPLSHMAASMQAHPFGLAVWINLLAAIVCFAACAIRGKLPRLNRQLIRFFLLWGGLSAASECLIFLVAESVSGAMISIILATESFVVFGIAAAGRIEKPSLRRFTGLVVGMLGVIAIIVTTESVEGSNHVGWILVTMIVPVLYAVEDIMVPTRLPETFDPIAATGYVSLAALILTVPFAWAFDDFVALSLVPGKIELLIGLIVAVSIVGNLLILKLLYSSGPVFASQLGYVLTFSGVLWSVVLLGDSLNAWSWAALAVMTAGIILVSPNQEVSSEQLTQTGLSDSIA